MARPLSSMVGLSPRAHLSLGHSSKPVNPVNPVLLLFQWPHTAPCTDLYGKAPELHGRPVALGAPVCGAFLQSCKSCKSCPSSLLPRGHGKPSAGPRGTGRPSEPGTDLTCAEWQTILVLFPERWRVQALRAGRPTDRRDPWPAASGCTWKRMRLPCLERRGRGPPPRDGPSARHVVGCVPVPTAPFLAPSLLRPARRLPAERTA
jgi:hypothetical protein